MRKRKRLFFEKKNPILQMQEQSCDIYRCESRTADAHIKAKNEDRVENDVQNSACKHRSHCEERIPLGENKRVQSLRKHYKDSSAGIYFQIRYRKFNRTGRTAEQHNYLPCKEKCHCSEDYSYRRKQYECCVENAVCFVGFTLAQLYSRTGRATQTNEVCKSRKYQRYGEVRYPAPQVRSFPSFRFGRRTFGQRCCTKRL